MRDLEVVYDFPAPWAFVAHERSRRRWAPFELRLAWTPFELSPGAVPPGPPRPEDRRTLSPQAEDAFASDGLPFKPSAHLPSTSLALRAALWCEAQGGSDVAGEFRDGVFRRLFERGLDNHLYDAEVLAGLVERVGLDPIGFLVDMKEGAFARELAAARERAERRGVRSVPTFFLDGRMLGGEGAMADLEEDLAKEASP